MGRLEIIFLGLLAVFSREKTLVEGQQALQTELYEGLPSYDHPSPSNFLQKALQISDGKGATPFDDQTLEWRLPRDVIPVEYVVRINPILDAGQTGVGEQWTTPGEVEITIQCNKATDRIVLHAKDIDINEEDVTVRLLSINIPVSRVTTGPHDFLIIELAEQLHQRQTYQLTIKFVSKINVELHGLYRSSYIHPDSGDRIWLATTQMEALHARELMPCFDEPALKSTFQFTIGRMQKYLSLFCTEKTGQSDGPVTGWVYDTYALTPVMSTYLLAVIISEFTFQEAPPTLFPGKTIRTYAPDHYIKQGAGEYAAENVAKVLANFSTYFDHTYPLTKMDSAAVPDFFFGAMENYGLNIYRETALLVFPGVSLESERFSVSSIIAHELAHQWFGNLVSPAWWTHIWLNEGFATYYASIGTDYTNPEFEPTKRFLNDAFQRSMEYAADPSYAHSVKIGEVEWASRDAMGWFGRMIYDQAGSLIRMMDGMMGTDLFLASIKNYIAQSQYGAAQQDNLFSHLNTLAKPLKKIPDHVTMKEVMDTWTLKAGFPLVRVSRASSNRIYVSQEKFTNNVGAIQNGKVEANNELWHIPISVATKATPSFDAAWEYWLDKDFLLTSWEINAEEWIILNAGATGYFRVLYDIPLTSLIKEQLEANHTVIEALTRSQLLDDYFTAAYQKYITIGQALELTSYLSNEDEIVVWNTVLKHLRKPFNLLPGGGGELYRTFRTYLLPKIKSAFDALGGLNEEFEERAGMPILRHLQFTDWLCALEDEECQTFAKNHVSQWKESSTNNIPRNIQQIVYCTAVATGTDDVFQFIKERYNDAATSTVQRTRLRNALACTADSGFVRELLEGSIDSGYFKSAADGSAILSRLAMTPLGRASVLQFVRENAEAIRDYFGNASPIASVYNTIASYASTSTDLNELEAIADEIADVITSIRPEINSALATVRGNIAWMADFSESFASFANVNKKDSFLIV